MIQASNGQNEAANAGSRRTWVLGWALATVILVVGYGVDTLHQSFGDPDSSLRLVEVRDFLGGQGWFDNIQHRMNPPDGVPMHWARTIDFLVGAPIALLSPLLGAGNAEIFVAFAYPLALLAVFMWLTSKIAGEIGARDGLRKEVSLAGVIVAALAFPAIAKFSPGSLDHHNVEMCLDFTAVLCLMRMHDKPWMGAIAGAALGLAFGVAAEAAPFVAAGLVVAGLLWLIKPDVYRRGLAWTGAGLAGASAFSFLILVPPSRWGVPVCDTMGASFLGFGLTGGAIAAALGFAPQGVTRTLWGRLAASAVLGAVALVVLVKAFPECSGGGYSALSADMTTLWMAQIAETRTLFELASDEIAVFCGFAGAALAGLVAAGFYLRKHWRHAEGWVLLGFLLAAWVILAWQVRGSPAATAFAVPFGGWAVTKARIAFRARPSALRALAFLGVAGSSAAAAWAGAGDFAQSRILPHAVMADYQARKSTAKDCVEPEAIAALNRVPPAVILGHFSLGPAILQRTAHSVTAAPYHRDAAGLMTMINAMRSRPDDARKLVAGSGADYLLVCNALPETDFYARHPAGGAASADTLAAKLNAGVVPDWLQPVDIGATPLKLYRIKR